MVLTWPHFLPFLAGFMVCLGCSLVAMRWVAPLGWMDVPRDRHQHVHATPRTGGIALLAALGLGLWLGWVKLPLGAGEWAMVFSMGLMGALDDLLDLGARVKALLSLACAVTLAALTWQLLKDAGSIQTLFIWKVSTGSALAFLLLCVWYWCIPQACNLIDGMNGLALGFFLLLALSLGMHPSPGAPGAFLFGALVALVGLNWPSGLQFLGDSGSLALGILFAVLAVHLDPLVPPNKILACFTYPILDVLMVMAIRTSNGQPLGKGDRNHFHHQWLRVTGGRRLPALALTLLPAFACMQVLRHYPGHTGVAWVGLGFLIAAALWFYAHSVEGLSRLWPSLARAKGADARPNGKSLAPGGDFGRGPISGGTRALIRPDHGDSHRDTR